MSMILKYKNFPFYQHSAGQKYMLIDQVDIFIANLWRKETLTFTT